MIGRLSPSLGGSAVTMIRGIQSPPSTSFKAQADTPSFSPSKHLVAIL
jgi:hypothetical protein